MSTSYNNYGGGWATGTVTVGKAWSMTPNGYGWNPSITTTNSKPFIFYPNKVIATKYDFPKNKQEPRNPTPNNKPKPVNIPKERPHETLLKGLELMGLC